MWANDHFSAIFKTISGRSLKAHFVENVIPCGEIKKFYDREGNKC